MLNKQKMLKDLKNTNNKENLITTLSIRDRDKISTQLTPAQIYNIIVSKYLSTKHLIVSMSQYNKFDFDF